MATLLGALSIGTRTNFVWSALRQLKTSICVRMGWDLDGLVLVLSFEFFCQPFLKLQTFKVLRILQILFL